MIIVRGKIEKEFAALIEAQLPDMSEVRPASFRDPNLMSANFPLGSSIPIATICLQDCTSALQEVRYALLESLLHIAWFRERAEPKDESAAVFFGKFYADDAALRLYAAGEHLANAIICMLEIKNELRSFSKSKLMAKKSVTSRQATVGIYLAENKPDHQMTTAVMQLNDSEDWQKTRRYRDDWVHSKPPIIKEMGIEYERRNRVEVSDGYISISGGGGDAPKYSVDELVDFVRRASLLFTATVSTVIRHYDGILDDGLKNTSQHIF